MKGPGSLPHQHQHSLLQCTKSCGSDAAPVVLTISPSDNPGKPAFAFNEHDNMSRHRYDRRALRSLHDEILRRFSSSVLHQKSLPASKAHPPRQILGTRQNYTFPGCSFGSRFLLYRFIQSCLSSKRRGHSERQSGYGARSPRKPRRRQRKLEV